jgi:hypothetical protein
MANPYHVKIFPVNSKSTHSERGVFDEELVVSGFQDFEFRLLAIGKIHHNMQVQY